MRPSSPVLATLLAGCAAFAFALTELPSASLTALALLAAAAILSEVVEESERGRLREPVDEQPLRLVSAVQLAAAIVLGPWPAVLVAGGSVLVARRFRGNPWRLSGFHAAAFALAALAGSAAFVGVGGEAGQLRLPDDLVPVLALALAYLTVRTLLLELVDAGEPFQPNLAAAAAETGLGATIALLIADYPWNVVVLIPIALALNRAYVRVARLRRETLRALETFANIVDERDPSTYRHSLRVAGYVDALARALHLPFSDIDRLRWAARLHDLGKVAVDASVLAKPAGLTGDEWAAVRRSPRLSARLLQRFHFASGQARAVEYHHERVDGRGYYGVAAGDLPLASHFLIVADSFDAMTTDRPYRPGLSQEEALAEIERNIGTQFHPAVAKAFVAVQRGLDPMAALEPEEAQELRAAPARYRLPPVPGARDLKQRPELVSLAGTVIALGGIGLGQVPVTVIGAAAAGAGLVLQWLVRARAEQLVGALRECAGGGDGRELVFDRLVERVCAPWRLTWASLVSIEELGLGGTVALARGSGPPDGAIVSWLVREAESGSDLIVAPAAELGRSGMHVALPLRRDNSALVGFLVLEGARTLPRHVELALRETLDDLSAAFDARPASGGGWSEDAQALQAAPNLRPLALGGLDERQAQTADLVTEQVQRGLDGDGVPDDLQQVVRGP